MKSFLKTTFLGGLVILLPVGIMLAVFSWVFGVIESMIEPLTSLLLQYTSLEAGSAIQKFIADIIVLAVIIVICFLIGLVIKTAIGRFIHQKLEKHILKIAPGYNLIKETVMQFLGNRPSPFSSVALVNIFGNDVMVTAFVTERHDNGMCSVFVPTGPNPTSGNIYHLKPEYVHHVDQPVEDVMRSIISCGAGSAPIIKAYEEK
jgi:uncharacterized membrane protein